MRCVGMTRVLANIYSHGVGVSWVYELSREEPEVHSALTTSALRAGGAILSSCIQGVCGDDWSHPLVAHRAEVISCVVTSYAATGCAEEVFPTLIFNTNYLRCSELRLVLLEFCMMGSKKIVLQKALHVYGRGRGFGERAQTATVHHVEACVGGTESSFQRAGAEPRRLAAAGEATADWYTLLCGGFQGNFLATLGFFQGKPVRAFSGRRASCLGSCGL